MSLLRPAQVEPRAVDRKPPDRCNACHRTGGRLAMETREGQELWLCIDFRSCNVAAKKVEV